MKIAIIGCGQIADAHIQEAKKIPGTDVVAVCDSSIHMAEQAALRFKIPEVYTNLELMLKTNQLDVVHITTPPSSHLPIAKLALAHGVHAYIEKPFVLDTAEAEELVAFADRAGKLICVGHNNIFDSGFLRLKEFVRQGKLGDVVHIDVTMGYDLTGPFGSAFMGDPTHWLHKLPGGLAQNNISHPLSLILEFLEDERLEVYARGLRLRKETYGDIRDRFFDELRVMLTGKYASAHMAFSCRCRPVQLSAVVYGTKCQAIMSFDARTLRIVEGASLPGPFQKVQWAYRDAVQTRREYFRNIANLLRARLYYFEGMHELFRRFYAAVEGKDEMPIPMSEVLRTTVIMDEIFQQCQKTDSTDGEI